MKDEALSFDHSINPSKKRQPFQGKKDICMTSVSTVSSVSDFPEYFRLPSPHNTLRQFNEIAQSQSLSQSLVLSSLPSNPPQAAIGFCFSVEPRLKHFCYTQ